MWFPSGLTLWLRWLSSSLFYQCILLAYSMHIQRAWYRSLVLQASFLPVFISLHYKILYWAWGLRWLLHWQKINDRTPKSHLVQSARIRLARHFALVSLDRHIIFCQPMKTGRESLSRGNSDSSSPWEWNDAIKFSRRFSTCKNITKKMGMCSRSPKVLLSLISTLFLWIFPRELASHHRLHPY